MSKTAVEAERSPNCPDCGTDFVTPLAELSARLWFCEWCGYEWAQSELHVLYRFYDKDAALLYVGITNSPWSRFRAHQRGKTWFKHVVRADMEHFPTREILMAAEAEAIRAEGPIFNIAHARATA